MKFKKKPVIIEAYQWNETEDMLSMLKLLGMPYGGSRGHKDNPGAVWDLRIRTLEGPMEVRKGDWIIRGVKGEFYPCKPDIFEMTYEAVP